MVNVRRITIRLFGLLALNALCSVNSLDWNNTLMPPISIGAGSQVALNSTAFCGCYLHDFLLYLRDAYESDHCDESLIASNTLRIRVCFGSCSKPNVQCMPSEYRKLVLKPSLSNPKASGVGLTVEEHLNCECGCPLTAQDCGPDQDLDEANCRCTFTGTHRPHPCETEIVCQRSGSLEFGLTEIRLEIAVTTICYPQPTVVRLHPNSSSLEDDDHRMVIVPAGVRVNRCVGCCEAPWQCVPTGYAQRSFQGTAVIYDRGPLQHPQQVVFYNTFEEHERCECRCVVSQADCIGQQLYNADTCSCGCAAEVADKCDKIENSVWDPKKCLCFKYVLVLTNAFTGEELGPKTERSYEMVDLLN